MSFFKFSKPQPDCRKCKLDKGCLSPKMKPTGEGRKKALIIAEAPGRTEDETGVQLVGDAGNLLRETLEMFDLNLDKDFWKTNAVVCRPPKNATPTVAQLKACKANIDNAIDEYKPEFIWLLGNSAVESFYMGRFSTTSIARWRRLCIPDKKTGAWVVPLYHPSYILRNSYDDNLHATFLKDVQFAVSCLNKKPPTFVDPEEHIKTLTDLEEIKKELDHLIDNPQIIAFDYETTSLNNPYGVEQKILCVSYTTPDLKTVSFPLEHKYWNFEETASLREYWNFILFEKKIPKIAHNMQFEDYWSRVKFDLKELKWEWCTKTAAHILDCRNSFTGLKFQAYINFGIEGYDKLSKKYMTGRPVNKLETMPIDKLLLYCGYDSFLTMQLYLKQKKLLGRKKDCRSNAMKFFMEGNQALSYVHTNGLSVDTLYYREVDESLKKKVDKLEQKMYSSKEAQKFKKHTGQELRIKTKDFSSKDLRTLFYDVLGYKPNKETKSGLTSIDEEALSKIKNRFARNIIKRRKLTKIRNTYINNIIRESINDVIHPMFGLCAVVSYRSSCSHPNL